MDHLETVRHFVIENFLFGGGESIKDDSSFLEDGIIDSTGMLELVLFLEETYNIKIADDELIPDNLDSLANIARFLEGKLDGGPVCDE